MPPTVTHLRAHDYKHLIERWRAVAKKAGIPLRRLVRADGYDLYSLITPALSLPNGPALTATPPPGNYQPSTLHHQLAPASGVYVSAGIHGDEPASTEGLITWAEAQTPSRLRKLPLLLLPCLNPWGLVNNRRCTATDIDLNRSFHLEKTLPVIRALKSLVAPYQLAASLMLHEDYDGQGVYLYEVQRAAQLRDTHHWGEALLTAARTHSGIPTDPRPKVDGRKITAGIHRRRIDHRRFDKIGFPEAIWLHLEHSARTFTVETPSEFAIEKRVAAQVAMIDETIRRSTEDSRPGSRRS